MQLAGEQEQQRILARATITPGRKAGCLCAVVEICGYAEESCRLQRFNLRTRCLAIASGRLGTYIRNRAWTLVAGRGLASAFSRLASPRLFRTELLANFKLHYDGWLALPAGLRRTLDLNSGDRLVAELVDGAIVLRPVNGSVRRLSVRKRSSPLPSLRCRHLRLSRPCRRSGRVVGRESADHGRPAEAMPGNGQAPLPAPKCKPGRPRKALVEEVEPVVEPRPSAMVGAGELWKLRPKVELTVESPEPEPVPPPRRPEPSRYGGR